VLALVSSAPPLDVVGVLSQDECPSSSTT
jgi:hypothetical protein